jgi:hypothetical protein
VPAGAFEARGRARQRPKWRRTAVPDATTAATRARRQAAERAAHRLALEVGRLRAEGVLAHAAIARTLTARGVPAPRGGAAWTHTTVARVLERAATA